MDRTMPEGWAFTASPNDEYPPILHDSVATRMEIEGRELRLFFPEGFRLLPNDPRNPYDTPLPTKAGWMVFTLDFDPGDGFARDELIRLEVFHDHYLPSIRRYRPSDPLFTTCAFVNVDKMIGKINSGKWKLEFYDEFKHYIGYMYGCALYTSRTMRRYCRCYFSVECRAIRYYWNEVSDKPEPKYD